MKQLNEIARERDLTATVAELTRAFEGISSMRISKIKDQVEHSQRYFAQLWQIYSQLRVGELFRFGRSQSTQKVVEKKLLIMITSEGSFSGDIDQRLVEEALKEYRPETTEIIVVGHHGATQLAQRGVDYERNFKLPVRDTNVNTDPLVAEVQRYASTTVYYPSYISLMTQGIKSIELGTAVTQRGEAVAAGEDVISEANYIFEPSTFAVVDHLERTMMQVALAEVILESKLAQYASRFKAMNVARNKADEALTDLDLVYNRTKRSIKDERTKEVISSLRKAGPPR